MSDIDPLQQLLAADDINTFKTPASASVEDDTAQLIIQADKMVNTEQKVDLFSKPRQSNKALFGDDDDDDDDGLNSDSLEKEIASLKLQRELDLQQLSSSATTQPAVKPVDPPQSNPIAAPLKAKEIADIDSTLSSTGLFDDLAQRQKPTVGKTTLQFEDDSDEELPSTKVLPTENDKPLFIPPDAIDPNAQSIDSELEEFKRKANEREQLLAAEEDLSLFSHDEPGKEPTVVEQVKSTPKAKTSTSFDMSLFDDDDDGDDSTTKTKDTSSNQQSQSILQSLNTPVSSSLFDDDDLFSGSTPGQSSSNLLTTEIGDDFDFNAYLSSQSK